jgi:hypothetical protein
MSKNIIHILVLLNFLVSSSFLPFNPDLFSQNSSILREAQSADIILGSYQTKSENTNTVSDITSNTLEVCSLCTYTLIQDAINAASPGDTLDLTDEFYTETIVITQSLTIKGYGPNLTTIQADGDGTSGAGRVVDVEPGLDVNIEGVTIRFGNGDDYGYGGGIRNQGNLTITNSVIISNTSTIYGGGIFNQGHLNITNGIISSNTSAYGGGIHNQGQLTITNSVISSNTANSHGGGIYNIGNIFGNYVILNIFKSSIIGNEASYGGGLSNVAGVWFTESNLTETTISGNSSLYGGGIYNFTNSGSANAFAYLNTLDSTIDNNTCAYSGGGINIQTWEETHVNLVNTTISNNTAGTSGTYFGGGIYINGYGGNTYTTLSNVTVSGNTSYDAGGIAHFANNGNGNISIVASTIYSNTVTIFAGGVGGIYNKSQGGEGTATMTMTHSIVAGSVSAYGNGDCYSFEPTDFNNTGYNIIENDVTNTCGTFFYTGNPGLGPLNDNGGPTFTHALLEGSPAIDAIPIDSCLLPTDQRGVTRPLGYGCDIGAYEVENYLLFLPLIMR